MFRKYKMKEVLLKHLYGNTSKDYCTLYHLVRVSRVICIVDYGKREDDYQIRDVCQSQVRQDNKYIDIGCRGYSYIWADTKEDFIKQCEDKNLEYFIPTKSPYDEN